MANTQSREHGSSGNNKSRSGGSSSSGSSASSGQSGSQSSRGDGGLSDLVGGETSDTIKRTASTVIDTVEQVADEFRKGSVDAGKLAQEYGGRAVTYAKSHPWQSIVAVGVFGLILGLLLKPRQTFEMDM